VFRHEIQLNITNEPQQIGQLKETKKWQNR
jgi:hypothetical protein